MIEQFQRFYSLLNSTEQEKINKAKVAIVGLGGVGSVAALTLARCGIKNFVICDFDTVQLSNINRQLIASFNTLDKYKTDACYDLIKEINPNANIIKLTQKYNESELFSQDFTYLIDAIDDVNSKFHLICKAIETNKIFISSMGTAKKMDITKLKITDIDKTSYDPLARKIRKMLKENNITTKFKTVSSTEEIIASEVLGSYMPVTATAGMMLADYIIKQIIK